MGPGGTVQGPLQIGPTACPSTVADSGARHVVEGGDHRHQGSRVWKLANRHPMQQQLARRLVLAIKVTSEDASGVYPSQNSSAPTAFTILAGSSNQFVTVRTSMFIALQAGVG